MNQPDPRDMNSFASGESSFSGSEEDDAGKKFTKKEEAYGNDSDFTDSSSGILVEGESASYTNLWPQSYRQSIEMYSTVPSPSIGFLGAHSLSRLGSSFFASSSNMKHAPDASDNLSLHGLGKPLLHGIVDEKSSKERQNRSYTLLSRVRLRKHSVKDERMSKGFHELAAPGRCSFGQAVLNCMNVLCGVGILSTPYALKEGGWIGLAILLMFASLSYYTGILLRRCLDSEPGLQTYPDIGQAAFGITGRIIISIILYVDLYACCVEYIILEADNISSLFPKAHLFVGGLYLNSRNLFALLSTIVVLPTVWLRDYRVMSYLSAGGVVATTLVVLCLLWTGVIDDHIGFHNRGTVVNLPNISVAIGVFGFCYSGHAVIPNIYLSLEKPNQFPKILLVSFLGCSLMYIGAAVMGFMMFGEATQSQFTLNMPQTLISSRIAVWTTVVNPLTKYAMTMMPVALSMEELMPPGMSYAYSILIRTALVTSTLILGLSVPFFGLVLALIGSFFSMLVTLIFPCACYLRILKGRVGLFQGCFCLFIIGVGVVSSSFGTYSALLKIFESLYQS